MRDNLTEYQRQHIIELLERGQGPPHAALGGQRSKAPRLRSSPAEYTVPELHTDHTRT